MFLDSKIAPDEKIVCIACDDPFLLGVLSSSIHVAWALAAGSRLGVGNDPTYNNSLCFDPFPFPIANPTDRLTTAEIMSRLHAHRAAALARNEGVTMTGMYNVIEKLRSGEELSESERQIHEAAACGVLRDLHEELDHAVARCYDWDWPIGDGEILARLVVLHDERRREETAGTVHWVRSDYQVPRFHPEATPQTEAEVGMKRMQMKTSGKHEWPAGAIDQIAAIKAAVAERPGRIEEIASRFTAARRALVGRHLDTLELLAEVQRMPDGKFHSSGASTEPGEKLVRR